MDSYQTRPAGEVPGQGGSSSARAMVCTAMLIGWTAAYAGAVGVPPSRKVRMGFANAVIWGPSREVRNSRDISTVTKWWCSPG